MYIFLIVCAYVCLVYLFFFFKQKTAYEMRISDWSSDVCSSDLKAALTSRGCAWRACLRARNSLKTACQGRPESGWAISSSWRVCRISRPGCWTRSAERWKVAGRCCPKPLRSEEGRVGKEGVRSCSTRWSGVNYKKKI